MKTLKDYLITESKSWKFNDDERDAFASALGTMLGNLGEEDEMEKYGDFKKTVDDEEFNMLDHIYDFLEDYENYSVVRSKMFDKNEIAILARFSQWLSDNDAANFNGRTDWDLIDAYEKILY